MPNIEGFPTIQLENAKGIYIVRLREETEIGHPTRVCAELAGTERIWLQPRSHIIQVLADVMEQIPFLQKIEIGVNQRIRIEYLEKR